MSDTELIESVKRGDNDSLIELVSRHERLYFNTASKFSKVSGFDFPKEKYHFFYAVAKDYDANRGMKFGTFLAQRTKFLCKSLISKPQREVELKDEFETKSEPNFSEELLFLKRRMRRVKDLRARQILLTRYFDTPNRVTPFSKIAKIVGMSARNTKYIHDRYINLIRKSLKHV